MLEHLYILPFDHRASFVSKLFGYSEPLSPQQHARVAEAKWIVWQGAKQAIETSLPRQSVAILVDEQFGTPVVEDARIHHVAVCLTTEKSGMDEFDFEYKDWQKHLLSLRPAYAKALVRYNPAGNSEANARSAQKLAQLSQSCHQHKIGFLLEPLIPATPQQITALHDGKISYDTTLRPGLCVRMVEELYEAGVRPSIWKIEGFEEQSHYEAVANTISAYDTSARIVVLGRGGTQDEVATWVRAGAGVPSVIGFAIGRTIFWEALTAWRDGTLLGHDASAMIAANFINFVKVFESSR